MTAAPLPTTADSPTALRGDSDWRIELFRAIAASMVLVVHYLAFFPGAGGYLRYFYTGVDLFFVLSGFVFAPYLVERKPLQAGPFFIRRFFRLYPLYLLSLAAYALMRWQDPALGGMALKHLFMLHTLENRAVAFFFNPAYWSLPPEVEFYLLLPAFAWLCARRGGFALLCAAALVSHLLVAAALPRDGAETLGFVLSFHLPGLLAEFLLGALAYAWVRRRAGSARTGADWLLLAFGLAFTALWGLHVSGELTLGGDRQLAAHWLTHGHVGLYAALGYAAVVAGAVRLLDTARVPRALERFALWAGGCSYGVYLLHMLMPGLIDRFVPGLARPVVGTAAALLTVAAAALLHPAVEAPLRRLGRRLAAARDTRMRPAVAAGR